MGKPYKIPNKKPHYVMRQSSKRLKNGLKWQREDSEK